MNVYHCEQDLLTQLIVLSPKNARREFRNHIFEEWRWKCAYCDVELNEITATIDHIIPKFRGGHHVKTNMCCCCTECNRSKGSTRLEDWYKKGNVHYCEERFVKLKQWI